MGKTLLPRDFAITDEMRLWASAKVPMVDIDREHESFCDYWWAHGKKMLDWPATWRMWMRRCIAMGGAMKPRVPLAPSSPSIARPVQIAEHPLFKAVAKRSA